MTKIGAALSGVKALDWPICDFSIMPVPELNDETEARRERATVAGPRTRPVKLALPSSPRTV